MGEKLYEDRTFDEDVVPNDAKSSDTDAVNVAGTDNVKAAKTDNKYEKNKHLITKDIIFEAFQFNNLKRMSTGAAVIWGILTCPLLFASFLLIAAYYVLLFVAKLISVPADFLLNKIKNDASKTATQVVTYVIGYPIIIVNRVILSAFSLVFFLLHLFITLFLYAFTFGGITFHPFLYDDNYVEFREKNDDFPVSTNTMIYILGGIVVVLLIVVIVFSVVGSPKVTSIDAEYYTTSPYIVNEKCSLVLNNLNNVTQFNLQVNSEDLSKIEINGHSDDFSIFCNGQLFEPHGNKISVNGLYDGVKITIKLEDYQGSSIRINIK